MVAKASRPHFVLPGRVVPDFGPFGCTSVCTEDFVFGFYLWYLLKVLLTWNQAGLRVVTATSLPPSMLVGVLVHVSGIGVAQIL